MASNPLAEGIEAVVFRTVGDQESLWEAMLRDEVRRLPGELARLDALLDDELTALRAGVRSSEGAELGQSLDRAPSRSPTLASGSAFATSASATTPTN